MHWPGIIGHTPFAQASVEEELQKLVDLELITTAKDGNRHYDAANRAHPLYPELHAIVLKTSGLKDLVAEALTKKRSPSPLSLARSPPTASGPKATST